MISRKRIVLTVILLALVLFYFSGLSKHVTLASLKEHQEALSCFAGENRLAAAALFMALYIAQSALSLPGAAILSLAAGAIFGTVIGTIYAITAATIGATIAFLVTRYLFHDAIQAKFGHRLAAINREMETAGLGYLLFLRLVPIFPFFLINLAAGLTGLPLRTFIIGTIIGIIPGGFVYVNAGASLATITSPGNVMSTRVLSSFALLGLFAISPVIYKKFARKF